VDLLPDSLNRFIANERLFRVKGVVCEYKRCGIALFSICLNTDFSFVFLPPKQHQCIVDRDSCKPSGKLGSLIKRSQGLERFHNGFLHHVIGVSGVARYGPDRASRGGRTLSNQLHERGVVASFTSPEQSSFGSRGIHRCAPESNDVA
jgi:hypothetical protein